MKKLLLFLLIFFASSASAQVAVTVTAEMGGSYAGGSITASNVTPGGTGTPALAFFFNSSGTVSAGLPSNGTWQFTFCNASNICFVAQISLSGLLTFDATTIFTAAAAGSSTATNGTGGTSSPASPVMAFYLSNACPTSNTGQCFYTPANTQQAVDCSWTAAGSTVACASSHFVAADIGKRVFGYTNCDAFNASLASNAASGALTTSAQLTISAQTGTGLTFTGGTAANTVAGNTHCLIWGTPDDAGAALLDTAAQAAPFCPRIDFAAAYYMFTDAHFYTQPTACANLGTIHPNSPQGNIFYSGAFELEGRGSGTTVLWMTPGFPENTTCNHGVGNNACWVQTLQGRWSNFQITGGMNALANGLGGVDLIQLIGPGSLDNFICTNWGGAEPGLYGVFASFWEQLYQVNISGCGGIGLGIGSGADVTGFKTRVENVGENALAVGAVGTQISGSFTCYDCGFSSSLFEADSNGIIQNNGGTIYLFRTYVTSTTSFSNQFGYYASTLGSNLYANNSTIFTGGTGGRGILCVAQCNTYLLNTSVNSAVSYYDGGLTTPALYDQGGNVFTGSLVITGQMFGEANSANSTAVTAAKLVLSAGWGSTAANTALSGGDAPIQFTITNSGTGQAATPTITYTFPTPYPVAPFSCTATDLSGSNPLLNPFTTSSLTKTGAVFTATGTPTVSDTEVMQITCVTP